VRTVLNTFFNKNGGDEQPRGTHRNVGFDLDERGGERQATHTVGQNCLGNDDGNIQLLSAVFD